MGVTMPYTGDRAIRASDEDRERAAAILGRHYAAGRLTSRNSRSGWTGHTRRKPSVNWTI
jgi:Domain of unknown function (DUF1707)